eukprot:CAMPEP_0172757310 /NCGR_PEP_ID=MMETSP1074-20121228/163523_1 /TAXON_ID=2916 /ORGANISM="Ceratium fusus, Strain PA161109" /LENGTH=212 /DNA_ID=CAMNT_0013590715 /DNA_START=325 /DNA_END=961 /DNA_ORIENTATION=-
MARIQVNHHRPTSFSGLTPHDFIKVTLVRPALQKLHVPLPWLCVPRSDAFFADWAEPVGAKHGFWWISVYAQHASIKPQGLEQRREEKCEAPLIGTRLNDETRLHSEDYVLQVHQVLRILQHLCPQPSTIAIHRVALEESVISIHDSGLIWLKQLDSGRGTSVLALPSSPTNVQDGPNPCAVTVAAHEHVEIHATKPPTSGRQQPEPADLGK